jgi:hypothetical protein
MMRKIIGNSTSHNLNLAKFTKSLDFMCTTCATEKLIVRPSPLKIKVKPFKEIFVDLYNHCRDCLGILWF